MLVAGRGIADKYKYNPFGRVKVPKICVLVLSSRAQQVDVIVRTHYSWLLPDLPAPAAQFFAR